MANKQDAIRLIDNALLMLERELGKSPDPLLLFVPRETMVTYRANLLELKRLLEESDRPPPAERSFGMARTIIQEWPFTFLGRSIVAAERAFEECAAARK